MNIRQLEAFRAVVLTGSVTNAANLMGISQPAVSRLITQLEDATRLTLFDRVKNRLVPSHEATLLFQEVDRIFASLDKVGAFATDLQQGRKGHIALAALPTLAQHFLPEVIADFRKTRPDVTVSLAIRSSEKIQETAATQQIDFGIVEMPLSRTGFESEPFCSVDDVVVIPMGHPLGEAKTVTLAALSAYPLVTFSRSNLGRLQLDAAFANASLEWECVIEAEHSAALCRLVAAGAGIGVVDILAAKAHLSLGLDFRRLEASIPFQCALLYPSFRLLSKPAKDFLALMRQARTRHLRSPEDR
jgi:DNA-binding transcriptional LysR family regulator